MSAKVRLDRLLIDLGLETSRERARARIMAGECRVDDQPVTKPGTRIDPTARVELVGDRIGYVSRGGLKLAQALEASGLDVTGVVALDVGVSTGGFTDCLLQHGAAKVYAIDVGYGQLAWKLRTDPRVVVMERTHIRDVARSALTDPVTFGVVDCSFISLRKVWPWMRELLVPGAGVIALVKPQFEAGRARVGKGGVVRDPGVRGEVVHEVRQALAEAGLRVEGGVDCATHGPKGNVEYLLWGRSEGPVNEPASPST